MRKRPLDKLYGRLTPEERFRLDIQARARGDEEDSRRLLDTCPRRTYTMNDWGFAGRWHAATELTMAVLLDLNQSIAKLRMINAFRVTQPRMRVLWQNEADLAYFDGHEAGSRHAWRMAGMKEAPPGWEDDEEEAEKNADTTIEADLEALQARIEEAASFVPRLLDSLEQELVGEALVVWEAFGDFCEEELGLEPEKILKALFEPALENVEWLKQLAQRLELQPPEREAVEEYEAALAELWRYSLGKV